MEFVKSFKKLRKLKLRKINGKSAILFFLNRKISALTGGRKEFGKLIDMQLDKKTSSISFDFTEDEQVSSIAIQEYRIVASKGRSCLTWSAMDFKGPAREKYRKIFQEIDSIEVSKQYISMMEVMI